MSAEGASRGVDPGRVTAVPRRMRLVCGTLAAVVIVGMLLVAIFLRHESTGVVSFGSADQVAMAGIGLLIGAGIAFLGRSKVEADAGGIVVQNIIGRHELPWALVDAVRFDRSSPWASLQLITGEEISLLGIQAVDTHRAVDAIDGLRALLTAARERAGADGTQLRHGQRATDRE